MVVLWDVKYGFLFSSRLHITGTLMIAPYSLWLPHFLVLQRLCSPSPLVSSLMRSWTFPPPFSSRKFDSSISPFRKSHNPLLGTSLFVADSVFRMYAFWLATAFSLCVMYRLFLPLINSFVPYQGIDYLVEKTVSWPFYFSISFSGPWKTSLFSLWCRGPNDLAFERRRNGVAV